MPIQQPEAFPVQDGQTLLFQGDSITDTDRRNQHYPYGWGYAHMVIDLITARYPDRRIRYVNRGISGHTTEDLLIRWTDDCIHVRPDWVSLMIGINDLCRWFNPNHEAHVDAARYRANLETLLGRVRDETEARLVLLEPFFISRESEPEGRRGMVLGMLDGYRGAVRDLAAAFDAVHVPFHDVFQEQLKYRDPNDFCPEPVHPNVTGHRVMAHAWLKAMAW